MRRRTATRRRPERAEDVPEGVLDEVLLWPRKEGGGESQTSQVDNEDAERAHVELPWVVGWVGLVVVVGVGERSA